MCQVAGSSFNELSCRAGRQGAVRRHPKEQARQDRAPRRRHCADEAAAAWCTFQSGSRYVVAATTEGGRRAVFMVSGTMFDPGSQGPAIP
jgi:hypothetical protein